MAHARAHPGRLPTHVRPRHYDLLIAPDLDTSTFAGEVTISLSLDEATSQIVLNAQDLDVELVELFQSGDAVPAQRRGRARRGPSRRDDRPAARGGRSDAHAALRRSDQRRPARFLPQHLHRRRREPAGARRDAIRGAARPRRLPVLRRTGVQSSVRGDARRRRRSARGLERPRDRPRQAAATAGSAFGSARRSRCRRISSPGSSVRSR